MVAGPRAVGKAVDDLVPAEFRYQVDSLENRTITKSRTADVVDGSPVSDSGRNAKSIARDR